MILAWSAEFDSVTWSSPSPDSGCTPLLLLEVDRSRFANCSSWETSILSSPLTTEFTIRSSSSVSSIVVSKDRASAWSIAVVTLLRFLLLLMDVVVVSLQSMPRDFFMRWLREYVRVEVPTPNAVTGPPAIPTQKITPVTSFISIPAVTPDACLEEFRIRGTMKEDSCFRSRIRWYCIAIPWHRRGRNICVEKSLFLVLEWYRLLLPKRNLSSSCRNRAVSFDAAVLPPPPPPPPEAFRTEFTYRCSSVRASLHEAWDMVESGPERRNGSPPPPR
mmetsp:Transcript_27719/g.65135  ORF Transcript_27719/g.65135 Transcript_27719/m.65135 type:complete len:275 (-) Transcript_27719:286-1110(-)